MAVSSVKKIQLIALKENQEAVFKTVYDLGATEIIENENSAPADSNLEYDLAQIDFALRFLQRYDTVKKTIREKLIDNKITASPLEIDKIVADFDYKKITEELTNFDEKLNLLLNDNVKKAEEIETLIPWKKLVSSFDDMNNLKTVKAIIGTINKDKYNDFILKNKSFSKKTEIIKIEEANNILSLQIIYQINIENELNQVLNEFGWNKQELPITDKKPADTILFLKKEIEKNKKEIKEIEKNITEHTKHIDKLQIISDYLDWELDKKNATSQSKYTNKTFSVNFWIENVNKNILTKRLDKISKDYILDEIAVKEKSEVPVPLRNNKLFEPFEAVTNIYGVPKSDEPDPTPFLTPFFVVFFGLALTDAGYGILLALGAFLVIKLLKIPAKDSKLLRVLVWGGISTFIFGALFGSWFGIDLYSLPPSIGNVLQKIQIIDAGKNPITVLIVTMILGYIQILVGLFVGLWWKIKHNQTKEGILDIGTWIYFLLSIGFWVGTKVEVIPSSLGQIALYMVYAGLITLVLTQGRKEKNPIVKLLKGVISLYDLVGYFSDMLSYSRLLALGLATGIIAMVINLIAFLFKDMIPYVGWLVAILILIGGHIFNVAINVLGAYIHSGRLQFVEFFPKFMEGGGKKFTPFARKSKYIKFKNN